MKNVGILLIALLMGIAVQAQTTWAFDKTHSNVGFSVTHLVISEVDGQFSSYDGKLVASKADFTDAVIDFEADINSISTGQSQRDDHLKSAEFFDAAKYPKLTFKGKGLTKVEGNKYKLTGDLTIKGVTKPVTMDVKYNGTVKGPYGNTKAGFKIMGEIMRKDFGLIWDQLTEAGGAVVSNEVYLNINMQLVKK
ncbi:MAG: YceI family protein [Bacteroidota bacterium]